MLILRLVFMLCQKICYAIYVYIYIKCQFSMCYLKNIWRKKKLFKSTNIPLLFRNFIHICAFK